MSYIVDLLKKKYLNKISTTKDLIYKHKIIDAHKIKESYNKLDKFWKIPHLKFGNENLFFDKENKIINKINDIFMKLPQESFLNVQKKLLTSLLISEINNSLWIEGIKSSKKKIKQIIKEESIFKDKSQNQINDFKNNLISSYAEALFYVLKTNEINESNLFALYKVLTRNVELSEK